MKIRAKFPRLEMVPYAMVEWLVKANSTPSEMRLWIEKQDMEVTKFQREDWELVNKFVMKLGQVSVSDKKSSMLALDVESVTSTF